MSFSKHEVEGKLSVTGDIGEQIDGAHTAAEVRVQHLIGGRTSLLEYAKLAEKIVATVNQDLEEGKIPVGGTELEIADYTKRKVLQVIEGMRNLADKMQQDRFIAEGQASAYRQAATIVQKYHDAAKVRQLQLQQAELELRLVKQEAPVEDERRCERKKRAPGEHPGRSPLDARRLAIATENSEIAEIDTAPTPVAYDSLPPDQEDTSDTTKSVTIRKRRTKRGRA